MMTIALGVMLGLFGFVVACALLGGLISGFVALIGSHREGFTAFLLWVAALVAAGVMYAAGVWS